MRERSIAIDKLRELSQKLRCEKEEQVHHPNCSYTAANHYLQLLQNRNKTLNCQNKFKMSITDLSTELLQKIYEYSELEDLLHIAQTSKRNYRAYLGRRLPLLTQAMHNSYSPLPSLLKLTLANEPDKSNRRPLSTELRTTLLLNRIITSTPHSLSLEMMKKMVPYGQLAARWTELYPRLRWRFASDNRRLLHARERPTARSNLPPLDLHDPLPLTNLHKSRSRPALASLTRRPPPPLPPYPKHSTTHRALRVPVPHRSNGRARPVPVNLDNTLPIPALAALAQQPQQTQLGRRLLVPASCPGYHEAVPC